MRAYAGPIKGQQGDGEMNGTWKGRVSAVLAAVAVVLAGSRVARAEERIMWITPYDGVYTEAHLQAAVDFAAAQRFNAICITARNEADAYYIPNRDFSTYLNREPNVAGSAVPDQVQFIIDRGREAGLRVYASFGCFWITRSSDILPRDYLPDWLDWVYKDVDAPVTNDLTYSPDPGFPKVYNHSGFGRGLWADPGVSQARDHTVRILSDFVQNYDVDGVILTEVGYPGDSGARRTESHGYNPTALAQMGAGDTPAPGAPDFIAKRQQAVTTFMTGATLAVSGMKKWVIVGAQARQSVGGSAVSTNSLYALYYQHLPSWGAVANPHHGGGTGVPDFVAPLYGGTNSSDINQLMGLFAADLAGTPGLALMTGLSSSSDYSLVAKAICDSRTRGLPGFTLAPYVTLTAAYMSSLNNTSTTGCGSGVMSTASSIADFPAKKDWDTVRPNNITDLAVRNGADGQVILTWSTPTPATDGDRPERYLVYRSASSPVKQYYENLVNRSFDVTGNSFVDCAATGLTPGQHRYIVVPVDDFNNRGSSNTVVSAVVPGPVIVESRTATGVKTASPAYEEYTRSGTSFGNQTVKSDAPGLAGSGTRYTINTNIAAVFQPTLTVAGNYNVYVTLPSAVSSNALANYSITHDGPTITGSVRLAYNTAGLANKWLPLERNVRFAAGGSGAVGGAGFQNVDGNNSTSRRFTMDAVKFEPAGGPVARWSRSTFDTAAGWSTFGDNNARAYPSHSDGAHKAHVVAAAGKLRVTGVISNESEFMPYVAVGPQHNVRAKFHVYRGGQTNPSATNQIPNMRLRVANRFAVTSMLEVYTHLNGDPEQDTLSHDFRPSDNADKPSVYRVDFDPVDVPYLRDNPHTEGFTRAFEAISTDPQDNGFLALTECSLSVYPIRALTGATPVKVYRATGSDAGDLKQVSPSDTTLYKYVPGASPGDLGTASFTGPLPTASEGVVGVTLSTTAVPASSIGVAVRNINPDRGTNDYANRVRVEPGRQYRARFRLNSIHNVNQQPQIRLRARTAKFGWSQKMELGGAWATDVGRTYPLNANNSIAQQALPGKGTQHPDSGSVWSGGWYTVLMHTPLEPEIRAEASASATLATRMPALTAQPGPGVASTSRRDLLFGIDLIDSISFGLGAPQESGSVTLDRIEVFVDDLLPD